MMAGAFFMAAFACASFFRAVIFIHHLAARFMAFMAAGLGFVMVGVGVWKRGARCYNRFIWCWEGFIINRCSMGGATCHNCSNAAH